MLDILYLIFAILLSVVGHECGHLFSALMCKVKVEVFSIGFWKPYIARKIHGIEVRITPWLIGGYVNLRGELKKQKNGFLALPYSRKVFILLSGVLVNSLIAVVCYLINYGSIYTGLYVDYQIVCALLQSNTAPLFHVFYTYNPNDFLLQLELINVICAVFNILPIPALDGGFLWLLLLEKKVKKFDQFLKKITKIGFITLTVLQILLVVYVWFCS